MCDEGGREGETGYESHITLVQRLTSMRGTFVAGRGSGGVGSVWEGRVCRHTHSIYVCT